jgi:lipoate-protein ligase B
VILDLGLLDYEKAYLAQRKLVASRKLQEVGDSLILAEHNPIFTIGRAGSMKNLLVNEELLKTRGIKVLRIDRGGDITFHGPGQVVCYPIIDLKTMGYNLHKYMRSLESIGIGFFGSYNIKCARVEGMTGVWFDDKKVASIGISATNWITFHGMSLNVNTDLDFFSMINPCGMSNVRMASLDRLLGMKVSVNDAKARMTKLFCEKFNITGGDIAGIECKAALA